MTRALTVWWDGSAVGRLSLNDYGEPEFGYNADWLASEHARPISMSLALRPEGFTRRESLPFFEGLLPEEGQRRQIAQALGVSHQNAFKLLVELGGEIAGALSLWPEGVSPPDYAAKPNPPLSDDALADMLKALPMRPMLAGTKDLRLSLAGAQSKLPVVYRNGAISLPAPGEPTTHIIKPPIARFEGTTENEALCMRLAERIGLSVASVTIIEIGDTSCLLIERFDRRRGEGGTILRLHQEDFCQALGFTSDRKYTADGGPRLQDCFDLVRRATTRPAREVLKLLDAVIFNMLIGNADAHGKNFSLLYTEDGVVLAPLYDLLSTVIYPELSPKFAMKIAGRATLEEFQAKDIDKLAEQTGLTAPYIRRRMDELAETVRQEMNGAVAGLSRDRSGAKIYDDLTEILFARLDGIERGLSAGGSPQ